MTPDEVPAAYVELATQAAFPALQTPRETIRLASAQKHTRAALAAVLPVFERELRARFARRLKERARSSRKYGIQAVARLPEGEMRAILLEEVADLLTQTPEEDGTYPA